MLQKFPFDLLFCIIELLSIKDLTNLSLVNKDYHNIIKKYGFRIYFNSQNWNILQYPIIYDNDWEGKVKFGFAINKNWNKRKFKPTIIARHRQALMPKIKFDSAKLICTVGSSLDVSYFSPQDPAKFYKRKNFHVHNDDITDIIFCCNNRNHIFTSSVDYTIKRFYLNKNHKNHIHLNELRTFYGHDGIVQSICQISDKSSSLISVGTDLKMILWDVETGEKRHTHKIIGKPYIVKDLSCNSHLIGVGNKSDNHLTLYYVTPTGFVDSRFSINNHNSSVYALASNQILPNTFVSGCYDGLTRLFDTRSMECIASYRDPYDLSPVYSVDYDFHKLASGSYSNGLIRLFDLRYYKNNMINSLKRGGRLYGDGWSVYLVLNFNSIIRWIIHDYMQL
nr:12704_t:CDS:2 [Entrophospora candida]